MIDISFKRRIPMTNLYRDVCDWMQKQNDEGFIRLTPEIYDLLVSLDPQWDESGEWLDALDHVIYVGYLEQDKKCGGEKTANPSSLQDLVKQGRGVNWNIRSIEDDWDMEMLMSDIMVKYCVSDTNIDDDWKCVIKETGILLKLYLLNQKTNEQFWNELLAINKTLQIINDKPLVCFSCNDKILMSIDYAPNLTLPNAQANDYVEIQANGKLRKFLVEEKTFSYNHPLGKLSEIKIEIKLLYDKYEISQK